MPAQPGQLQPDQQIEMMNAGLAPEMPTGAPATGPSNGKITPAKRS